MFPVLNPTMRAGTGMFNNRQLQVVKMVVQTAGTYGDQWRRPMSSHADGRIINLVEDVLRSNSSLDPLSLAIPAFDLLKPNATPEGRVNIIHGWQTARYRFMLHVAAEDNMGMWTDHYYSGYSDVSDPSYSGHIDPNAVFTIGSVTSSKRIRRESPGMGVHILQSPIAHNQILMGTPYGGLADPDKTYSLRPETVVEGVINESLQSVGDLFLDGSSFISQPTASVRSNNSPADYMSRIMRTYRNSSVGNDDSSSDPRDGILENAKRVLESEGGSDYFMEWLKQRRITASSGLGLGDMLGFHQFTLKDLAALDPTSGDRVKPADSLNIINNFHSAGQTCDWGASTLHAQTSSLLAQSLPTYMNAYHFDVVHLHATNMTMDGQINVLVNTAIGVNAGVDTTPFIEAFKQRLRTEMLSSISHGNSMPFQIEIKCDLRGETWITISLAQQNQEEFVCPTFCDSVFAPMLTQDRNVLNGLTGDFSNLFSIIDETVGGLQFQSGAASTATSHLVTPSVNVQSVAQPFPTSSSMAGSSMNFTPVFGNNTPGF